MRVYGFYSDEIANAGVKSTANYNRVPLRTATDYAPLTTTPSSAPQETNMNTSHRVAPGENLTRIVRDFLETQGGTPSNKAVYDGVRRVAESNGLQNANLIHPGQDLDLSILQSRISANVTVTPQPVAASIISTPLPRPESAPADPLRLSALSQRDLPIKVTMPSDPLPETELADAESPIEDELSGKGGDIEAGAVALQHILNATADALALVRELLGEDDFMAPPAETTTAAASTTPWDNVLKGRARISSDFGMRKDPFTGRSAFHDGIDLAAPRGTEITAIRGGEVVYSGWQGGYGNTVVVRHEDGLESVYGHTSKIHVSAGDTIQAGTVIANVGSTGRSTGPHLHLEVRRHGKAVNPLPHLENAPLRLAQNESGS